MVLAAATVAMFVFMLGMCALMLLTPVTMHLLLAIHKEPAPDYFPQEARKLVAKKRGAEQYLSMACKMICVPWVRGFATFSELEQALRRIQWPDCDAVAGITSGGWLIALMLAVFLQKPCHKVVYSRYNNKSLYRKARVFFKGRTEIDPKPPEVIPPLVAGQRVLLVDDSVGSGATMRICKQHLSVRNQIFTFAVCAPRKKVVDLCIFDKLCLVFPWGLDV